jgi:hypothetical protein
MLALMNDHDASVECRYSQHRPLHKRPFVQRFKRLPKNKDLGVAQTFCKTKSKSDRFVQHHNDPDRLRKNPFRPAKNESQDPGRATFGGVWLSRALVLPPG